MTDTKNPVSDERLAHYIEYADLVGDNGTPAISTGELASMARELQSLRASIPGGVGVKVKKLKWQTLTPGFSLQRSACLLGDYRVWEDADGAWEWALNDEKHSDGCEETPDAAKAAAQADYERRILSALDLSPAEPVGMVIFDDVTDDLRVTLYAGAAVSEGDEVYAAPSNPVISDEWPEPPEGWQRTKPTYARKDGALRVEFVHGREGTPWCVSMSLGNGACATLSYHATPQEALTAALSVKPQGGENG